MAQVKGLSQSKGMPEYKPYVPGEYVIECEDWQEETENSMLKIKITSSILEGPEQDDEGTTPEGKQFTHMINIPEEDHPSYSERWYENSVGELKDALVAFGVPMEGDSYDPENAIERTARVKLGIKNPSKKEKENGYDQKRNKVNKWMPDEDAEKASSSGMKTAE